jgi:hypothetical protein
MGDGAKYKTGHGNPRKTRTFMVSLGSDGIQEVVGSIPISSTFQIKHLARSQVMFLNC